MRVCIVCLVALGDVTVLCTVLSVTVGISCIVSSAMQMLFSE